MYLERKIEDILPECAETILYIVVRATNVQELSIIDGDDSAEIAAYEIKNRLIRFGCEVIALNSGVWIAQLQNVSLLSDRILVSRIHSSLQNAILTNTISFRVDLRYIVFEISQSKNMNSKYISNRVVESLSKIEIRLPRIQKIAEENDLPILSMTEAHEELEKSFIDPLNHFLLYYQPIFTCKPSNQQAQASVSRIDMSKSLVGFEALIRWNHQSFGTLSPFHFLGHCERLGMMKELTKVSMKILFNNLGQISDEIRNTENVKFSFNVTHESLNQNFLTDLISVSENYRIPLNTIKVEITETDLIEGNSTQLQTMKKMKDEGIDVAIDDFGMAYANLNYLSRLPISSIKIDRAFVQNVGTHEQGRIEVLRSIYSLASKLGLDTVTEGVETFTEYDVVTSVGADKIQGYLFGPPEPWAEAMKRFIKSGSELPR